MNRFPTLLALALMLVTAGVAANAGNVDAACNPGMFHQHGDGVVPD